MARGFESKSVADQQESAQAVRRPRRAEADPAAQLRRKKLELAKADIGHRMDTARAEGHREMLRRALAAIDKELAGLE